MGLESDQRGPIRSLLAGVLTRKTPWGRDMNHVILVMGMDCFGSAVGGIAQ